MIKLAIMLKRLPSIAVFLLLLLVGIHADAGVIYMMSAEETGHLSIDRDEETKDPTDNERWVDPAATQTTTSSASSVDITSVPVFGPLSSPCLTSLNVAGRLQLQNHSLPSPPDLDGLLKPPRRA